MSKIDIKDKDQILEIGFGNGKLISKFFEINPTIQFSGIDFSEKMCEEALKSNKDFIVSKKIQISCQDSLNLSFNINSFDKVVTINTIYFWPQVEPQLKEINRVLKTGGQLVIGYRPKKSMINLPFTQEVFSHYDANEFQQIIQKSGFKIIKEETQLSSINAMDGSNLEVIDICLIVEKIQQAL